MTFRMAFSAVAAMACGVLPLALTGGAAVSSGYINVGIAFGIIFSLPFLAVFFTTREREGFQHTRRSFNIRRSFTEPLKNRSFRNVLVMYLFTFVAMDIVLSVVIYFMTYYLRLEDDINFILGALVIVQMCGIPAYFLIAKKWGKTVAFTASGVIWVVAMLSSLLLKPGAARPAIVLFGASVGLGTSGAVLMVWSIFADIPDIDELVSGERREGLYSGLFTFMRKISSAVGLFLVSNLLSIAGYQNPQAAPGPLETALPEQSQGFLLALRLIFALIPVVFVSIALIGAARFPLTPSLHETLKRFLERRREGLEVEDPALESRLKSALHGGGTAE
jgi:oligogalacturonide transporter